MGESSYIVVKNLNIDLFKHMGVTPEEILANALHDADLLRSNTSINEQDSIQLCNAFLAKKEKSKQTTKLGNLLVKNKIITLQQLKEALSEQQHSPTSKLGNILIQMGACSKNDIENCIKSQNKIREDMDTIDTYQDRISLIRKRLSL